MTTSDGQEDPDLAAAVAERALLRATAGTALASVAVGALAVVFLALAGSRWDATTAPVVVLLGVGQLGGIVAAGTCAGRLRAVRARTGMPAAQAGVAARALDVLVWGVSAAGALAAAALSVLVQPRAVALLSALLGLGVLAQVVVVMVLLRSRLRRVARRGSGRP